MKCMILPHKMSVLMPLFNSFDNSTLATKYIIPTSGRSCKPAKCEYKKSSFAAMFEVLQFLRKEEVFCDIKLKTEDGTIIFGHKVVLASASPYFHSMFRNFAETNEDLVVLKQIDSTTLQLIVDFIYSVKIMVTEKNVQVLLLAANQLLLNELNEMCCDFLQKQLRPTNCLGIKALADIHNCTQLSTSSELYIQQNFSKVVEGHEFLSLSFEQIVKLIASDEITVSSEEIVFECVIRWVKHKLDSRQCLLPKLMEQVRLPLTSKNYICSKVIEEPLLNNSFCKDYIIEAFNFHLHEPDQLINTIPNTIRTKHRLGDKVIFVVGGQGSKARKYSTEWYDPKIKRWLIGPKTINHRNKTGIAVLKDNVVFAVGGVVRSSLQSVDVLDLCSQPPCWKSSVNMLIKRNHLGVGVINNYLYAVGGFDDTSGLNSAEVFNCKSQEWRMISSMSTGRFGFGLGVLNNLLYAVGGYDESSRQWLNSVECYHPSLNIWTPVAEMSVRRIGLSVGVLDGVLYAVGGHSGLAVLRSVEAYRPSTGLWTTIADMHLPRQNAGVVALYGLLYVIGGSNEGHSMNSIEVYSPITNTWFMLEASMNSTRVCAGVVVIDRPPSF